MSIAGLAGCAGEVAAPEPVQAQEGLPPAVVEYIEALNTADQQALALLMAFPGSHYPDEDQVDPDDIPQACIDGELDALGGQSIDASSAGIMGTYADYEAEVESSSLAQQGGVAWIKLPDDTAVGRVLAAYPDGMLIEPEWTTECTAAAEELYG